MKIGEFLENHLFALLCAGLALFTGYLSGQNETQNKVEQQAKDLVSTNETVKRLERINRCLLFHVTRLETGHTGQVPNCEG